MGGNRPLALKFLNGLSLLDWFFLYQIGKNVDKVIFGDFVEKIAKDGIDDDDTYPLAHKLHCTNFLKQICDNEHASPQFFVPMFLPAVAGLKVAISSFILISENVKSSENLA